MENEDWHRMAQLILSGNTKQKESIRTRARRYAGTLNNWTQEELDDMVNVCNEKGWKYVIGKEICPTTGTPHLQWLIWHKNPVDFHKIKESFPRAHIEKCKMSLKTNSNYCKKDGDYITNVYDENPKIALKLLPWQEKILEMLKKRAGWTHY